MDRGKNWLDRFTTKQNIQLSEEQRQAVETSTRSGLLILTGGPGTGKTTTTKAIVALWKAMGKRIANDTSNYFDLAYSWFTPTGVGRIS